MQHPKHHRDTLLDRCTTKGKHLNKIIIFTQSFLCALEIYTQFFFLNLLIDNFQICHIHRITTLLSPSFWCKILNSYFLFPCRQFLNMSDPSNIDLTFIFASSVLERQKKQQLIMSHKSVCITAISQITVFSLK